MSGVRDGRPSRDRLPVVAIDGRLLAYRNGGIPRYVRGLLTHLPAAAPDLLVLPVVNRPADLPDSPVLRVFTPPHHRLERVALGAELAWWRAALIHSTDFVPPYAPLARAVATVHDLAFLDSPDALTASARRYYRGVEHALGTAERVIAVSETTRRRVIERLSIPPERVATVYHGVDEGFFAPPPEPPATVLSRELGTDVAARLLVERPLVLTVGTVEPRKRHGLLVGAVSELAGRRPDATPLLVVAGERGWNAADTEVAIARLAERGLAVRLPHVSDPALRALYRSATLLAMPSRDEGFGLPVVEAMAAGLPVVAADRGALPEIMGDSGSLVSEDSPVAWADAIAALLDDAERRAGLSSAGRSRAERFRWEETARRTATVYREVLAG